MDVPPLSVDALTRDLRELGIVDGDAVMVHASLRRIGPVEGGAQGVVAALDAAVGTAGTILMTLGATDDPTVPFDHLLTPADPDVGVLAEVFRQLLGTEVSDHPQGRFGARGRLARAFVETVPWDDYYGPGSPLDRLVHAGGKVLRLGADPDTVTLLHFAEYLAPVEHKRRVRREGLVVGARGPEIRAVESLDDTDGIAPYPGEDYFGVILRAYLATGRASRGTVGAAPSELLDAADLVTFGAAWMGANLRP